MSDEPLIAQTVTGPAILAAVVVLFVHAATSALLTVFAIVFSEGVLAPDWTVAPVWLGGVVVGALSTTPILRRVARPAAVGVVAGTLAGVLYTSLWLGVSGSADGLEVVVRATTFAVAGAAAGARASRRPVRAVH